MNTNFNLSESKLSDDGKYVLKTGLIFRAGDYKDKDFSMTAQEIKDAEAAFEACPIDVEHVDNLGILDGKLGTLTAVASANNGEELYGTAKIPVWLNELNKDEHGNDLPFRVSSTIDRKSKKIKKLAIVKNPRVSDAALMAAFTENQIKVNPDPENVAETVGAFFSWAKDSGKAMFADQTYHGKWAMQDVHDQMARAGAICTKPKDDKAKMSVNDSERKVEFVSKEESAAIQKMHDLAVSCGGKCSFIDEEWAMYSKDDKTSSDTNFGRKNMIKEFGKWLKGQPDEVLEKLEADFSGNDDDAEKVALKAKVAELTAKVNTKVEEKVEEKKAEEFKAEEVAVDPEKEELKKIVAELQSRNLKLDAEKFAEDLIKDSKIVPASKEAVIAMFMQATEDDRAKPATEVNFSNEKVCKTRTEVLAEFFATSEVHNLSKEELAGKNVLNFNKGTGIEKETVDFAKLQEEAKAEAIAYAQKRNKSK